MPRFPQFAPHVAAMPGSVYSAIAARVMAQGGPVFPLHVGDTWLEPPPGCRVEDLRVADHPWGLHKYTSVAGWGPLVDGIVKRVSERTGLNTDPSEVLVTAGATGGLGAVLGALMAPGDELMIVAPYWPLIAGIARAISGQARAVPIMGTATDVADVTRRLEAGRSDRTTAIYLNTPNNPTGQVIPRDWVEAMVAFAKAHDLWIIADEVYEDYVYDGGHTYTRPLAPDRTFAAYSFSKAYGMAGNRVGYVVGPADAIAQARKLGVHTIYSAPTASQVAAARVLERGTTWLADTAGQYAEVGRAAASRLGIPAPQGSTFLWVDVADRIDERGLAGVLDDLGDQGVLVAPGPSFGPYETHLRVCFTATEPARTLEGFDRLANVLGR
ncbi:MAG: pyridoxal phosphate-dependent aminotransferase [Myxococcota bacterium]